MKTLMTVPLHWNEPVHEGLALIPTQLTINDGIYNPFDQLTSKTNYIMPEKVPIEWFGHSVKGIDISIEMMVSDEMVL